MNNNPTLTDPWDYLLGPLPPVQCDLPECDGGVIREYEPADSSVGVRASYAEYPCERCIQLREDEAALAADQSAALDHHYGSPVAGPRQYLTYGGGQ